MLGLSYSGVLFGLLAISILGLGFLSFLIALIADRKRQPFLNVYWVSKQFVYSVFFYIIGLTVYFLNFIIKQVVDIEAYHGNTDHEELELIISVLIITCIVLKSIFSFRKYRQNPEPPRRLFLWLTTSILILTLLVGLFLYVTDLNLL